MLTLGVGFTNVLGRRDPAGREMPPPDNGKDIYSVSVDVNLPIFRRKYDAGVLEAGERLIASKQHYRAQVRHAEASIRSVGFRLETIRRQIALFADACCRRPSSRYGRVRPLHRRIGRGVGSPG